MGRPASSTSDVLLYFLALFLPPVPVFLKAGCGADFLINIGLSILGWIPGVIHAWWIISKRTTPSRSHAAHGATTTTTTHATHAPYAPTATAQHGAPPHQQYPQGGPGMQQRY